jgi:predicted GH43/DUF377 family glycosyl hydrolase
VLNPTFVTLGGERLLIVRVDEQWAVQPPPRQDPTRALRRLRVPEVGLPPRRGVHAVELLVPASFDPTHEPILPPVARRFYEDRTTPTTFLSHLAHLRVVRISSETGATVLNTPLVSAEGVFSQFGCEDPRACVIDGTAIIAYTALGRYGATSWYARLNDKGSVADRRMMLGPDHKHGAFFPERVSGNYHLLARPLARTYVSETGIWLFESPDLIHWGEPTPLLFPRQGMWDSVRVGPASSPIRLGNEWLLTYYGVDADDSYHLGAALLDGADPSRVVARTRVPLLSPCLEWERVGRRADAVFACGIEPVNGSASIFRVYYGAADTYVGVAELTIEALHCSLETATR